MLIAWTGKTGNDGIERLGWYHAAVDPCSPVEELPKGYWKAGDYNNGNQSFSYKYGVRRSYTDEVTETWGREVTETVERKFEFLFGSTTRTISGTVSESLARMHSETFEEYEEREKKKEFGPGQIWQWTWDITDACGLSMASTDSMVVTPNMAE